MRAPAVVPVLPESSRDALMEPVLSGPDVALFLPVLYGRGALCDEMAKTNATGSSGGTSGRKPHRPQIGCTTDRKPHRRLIVLNRIC